MKTNRRTFLKMIGAVTVAASSLTKSSTDAADVVWEAPKKPLKVHKVVIGHGVEIRHRVVIKCGTATDVFMKKLNDSLMPPYHPNCRCTLYSDCHNCSD